MKIGIIGSGRMGGGFGKAVAARGHEVMYSHSREAKKLQALAAATPGATVGTVREAAEFGEVVFLSVWVPQLDEVLREAGALTGKALISCVSGLAPDFAGERVGIPTELTVSIAETIALAAPGAKVVEAFNLTFAEVLDSVNRDFGGSKPSLPYCGDDAEAKQLAAGLIADCGYDGIDVGGLKVARHLETMATAWVQMAVVGKLFPGCAPRILRR